MSPSEREIVWVAPHVLARWRAATFQQRSDFLLLLQRDDETLNPPYRHLSTLLSPRRPLRTAPPAMRLLSLLPLFLLAASIAAASTRKPLTGKFIRKRSSTVSQR